MKGFRAVWLVWIIYAICCHPNSALCDTGSPADSDEMGYDYIIGWENDPGAFARFGKSKGLLPFHEEGEWQIVIPEYNLCEFRYFATEKNRVARKARSLYKMRCSFRGGDMVQTAGLLSFGFS